jgi:ketosteroid isomerase-like protein
MTREPLSKNSYREMPSELPRITGETAAATVVSAFYDALLAEDAPRALGLLAADIAWYEMPGGPYARPDGQPYQGPAAIAGGVLARQLADVEALTMMQHEMLAYGDSVIVLGTATGRGRKTGTRLEVPFAHVWMTRDGQITEFRQYIDPQKFLEAVA